MFEFTTSSIAHLFFSTFNPENEIPSVDAIQAKVWEMVGKAPAQSPLGRLQGKEREIAEKVHARIESTYR